MHIPDGYIGPKTFIPLWFLAGLVWVLSFFRIRRERNYEKIALAGIFSALSFVLQMFNIPLPGGTTAHVVGTGIIAIVLGPALSIIALSCVLVIQALLFGDGGITAIGANCFNMAILFSITAWLSYKVLKGAGKFGKLAGAFLAGYLGINISALATAVEIGLQPLIERTVDGTPLYSPYSLSIAIPAMMIAHLLIVGVIEGLFTLLLVRYFMNSTQEI